MVINPELHLVSDALESQYFPLNRNSVADTAREERDIGSLDMLKRSNQK